MYLLTRTNHTAVHHLFMLALTNVSKILIKY